MGIAISYRDVFSKIQMQLLLLQLKLCIPSINFFTAALDTLKKEDHTQNYAIELLGDANAVRR